MTTTPAHPATPNPYTCLHGNTTRLTADLDRCNLCLAILEWCEKPHMSPPIGLLIDRPVLRHWHLRTPDRFGSVPPPTPWPSQDNPAAN